MKYSLVITKNAQEDILDTLTYISSELKSPQSANNLYDEINKELTFLPEMPEIYPVINSVVIGVEGIRFVLIKNYIAFYTVDNRNRRVNIIRFLYNKRNWRDILKAPPVEK